tara:strand:+ start:120 stop:1220 length:1101 start_codon:yes stop_codon:yes gene_type:complete
MSKIKTAFITFFPINPNNMGSSTVVNSRFNSWPTKKKIFQISHLKKINNKSTKTISIKRESPLSKIIKLPLLIIEVIKYLKFSKKKIIIIEGASWIFYSFFTIVTLKLIIKNCKIIYVSHSIESEIRRKYSNFLIYLLTKKLEHLVFRFSEISTSVSNYEKRKIFDYYKKKTVIYPNAISLINFKSTKKEKYDYIIYTGSYLYKPNREAIDYLNNHIMPRLIKIFPQLKLVITGGGFEKKFPWLVNKGIISKKKMYNLIFNAKCMCIPLDFGSGTRIKIIEALSVGTVVVSTPKGIEGIKLKNKNPPYIINKKKLIINIIKKIMNNNKILKKKANLDKTYYKKIYSMNNITKNFIKNNLNKYVNES